MGNTQIKNPVDKIVKASLSTILAVGMLMPLTSCQSSAGNRISSGDIHVSKNLEDADDVRWANFDDGCEALSLSVPYINSNADLVTFRLICDLGSYVSEIPLSEFTLEGALQGWQVSSVNRVDDMTLDVTLSHVDHTADNGASIGYICVPEQFVKLASNNSDDAIQNDSENAVAPDMTADLKEYTQEEINELKGTEWPSDVETVNEDVGDASLVEMNAIDTRIPDSDNDAALSDEQSLTEQTSGEAVSAETPAALYRVAVVYANPALTLDLDNSKIDDTSFKMVLVASDFRLPQALAAESFVLKDAPGCTISSARRISDAQAEVTLTLPQKGPDALQGSRLVLSGKANESEADVVCPLDIPTPWLSLAFGYHDERENAVVFEASLQNSTESLDSQDIVVEVDGKQVKDANVSANADGTYDIAVDADLAKEGSVVTADVTEVADVANRSVDVEPVAAIVESISDTREPSAQSFKEQINTIKNLVSSLPGHYGMMALDELVKMGWKSYCEYCIGRHDISNKDIFDGIVKIQGQISDISLQISALSNNVLVGQNRQTVDNANQIASRIKTEELQLSNKVQGIINASDEATRMRLCKEFAESEKTLIDNLATDMGVFYHLVMSADSSTGHDLIMVYDDLMAQSYNWGAQTYDLRQDFRERLASLWVNGAQAVALGYSITGNTNYLQEMDRQSADLQQLISVARKIDPSCYVRWSDGSRYCNTTARWCKGLNANQTADKWDRGFQWTENKISFDKLVLRAASPFRSITNDSPDFSWESRYMNTTEVKTLISKLHDGQTLKAEFDNAGILSTRYLITSDRFDHKSKVVYVNNDWYMDTFEIANSSRNNEAFTHDMKHYDGSNRYAVVKYIKHINWYTPCTDMFVLMWS